MSKGATARADVDTAEENEAGTSQATKQKKDRRRKRQPRYNVVLWDDDDHSFDYVIKMMQALFGHSYERGYQMAVEVDTAGRAICLTTTMEHAELKRDQIHAYGRDRRIAKCSGSMSASIEPVE
jgi:ATP-dependent Clp protease adaptor protein ClpS